jgi:hypothetical protein
MKRSMGTCVKQHFNGHFRYETVCRAEVCNPSLQSIVAAVVKSKNALGIHAESSITIDNKEFSVLDILIPRRTAGIISEVDLDTMATGDRIYVQIINKKYQLYDKHIEIIGRAVASPNSTIADKGEGEGEDDIVIAEAEKGEAPYGEDYDEDDEDQTEKEDEDDDDELIANPKQRMRSEQEEEEADDVEEEESLVEEDLPEEEELGDEDEGYRSDGGYDYV